MKRIILLIFVLATMVLNTNAQSKKMATPQKPIVENGGEMKTYVLVFLKSGPNRDQPEENGCRNTKIAFRIFSTPF